jgi:integrase/recombinase XerD
VSDLLFEKDIVKGKETARMVPVNQDGRKAITELLRWHRERYGSIDGKRPLFISRQHGEALSRSRAHRILESAFQKAGLNGKLATHSLRKTFAQNCYDACGDIYQVGELLGHKNVETTKRYIGISYAKLQATVRAIEINKHRGNKTLHSLSHISTGDLLTELQARGLDVSSAIRQLQAERKPKIVARLSLPSKGRVGVG